MRKRKFTDKLTKLNTILEISRYSKWCNVNTDNEFTFQGEKFEINESVKQYKVFNKPEVKKNGQYNNWTNEALMDRILCVSTDEGVRFFDQNIEEIDCKLVKCLA